MVMMMPVPKGSLGAYYKSMKEHRAKIAQYYEDHPKASIPLVMKEFRVSRNTVRRALKENGIEVEVHRGSPSNSKAYKVFFCSWCQKKIRHYCSEEVEGGGAHESHGVEPKTQVDSKLQEAPAQELDHIPLKDEDWAFSDDRLREMLQDGIGYDQIVELLTGNSTPFPKDPRAKEVASCHLRYSLQFQGVAPGDYPKGIPLDQLL